jgi:diamine N-acetyltransferase
MFDSAYCHKYWFSDRFFFIDRRYQGRGYGKEALRLLLEFIRDHHPQCQALHLTVHPENEAALRLYIGVGFQPTGAIFSDEPVYRLSFKSEMRQKTLLRPSFCIIGPAEKPPYQS